MSVGVGSFGNGGGRGVNRLAAGLMFFFNFVLFVGGGGGGGDFL